MRLRVKLEDNVAVVELANDGLSNFVPDGVRRASGLGRICEGSQGQVSMEAGLREAGKAHKQASILQNGEGQQKNFGLPEAQLTVVEKHLETSALLGQRAADELEDEKSGLCSMIEGQREPQ